MGTLLVPLGVPLRRVAAAAPPPRRARTGEPAEPEPPRDDVAAEIAALGVEEDARRRRMPTRAAGPLSLPFARRDLERLRLILLAQRRAARGAQVAPGAARAGGKGYFEEAVRWLEIHGGVEGQELAAQWRSSARPIRAPTSRRPRSPAAGAAPRAKEGDGRAAAAAAAAAGHPGARRSGLTPRRTRSEDAPWPF